MKKIALLSMLLGSLVAVPSYADNHGTDCSCTKECKENCSKGKTENCKCKECDCKKADHCTKH